MMATDDMKRNKRPRDYMHATWMRETGNKTQCQIYKES